MEDHKILIGDCRVRLDEIECNSIQCCVTSPPYWQLRDYGTPGEIGSGTLPEFVNELGHIFDQVKNVLRPDGVLWLNLGDTYAGGGGYSPDAPSNKAGSKQSSNRGALPKPRPIPEGRKRKDLLGVPWMVALELQRRGWYLRSEIIWEKTNALPEPVRDRPARSHEHVFLLSRSARYFFDPDTIREESATGGTRVGRSVWRIAKSSGSGTHTAVFPDELVRRCIAAGSRPGDVVLDPFAGSGTTMRVAKELGRKSIGIELNPNFIVGEE